MIDNKKTVLISGSGGLLGSELIRQLIDDKTFHVVAMTSQVDKLEKQYEGVKNVTIASNESWSEELKGNDIKVDYLINCAFPRSSKPKELAKGIPFTEKLIKKSIQYGIKNIINISSQSVYSQRKEQAATEDTSIHPENLYGMTKFSCERIVSLLCENYNVNYSNIRLASLTSIDFNARMTNKFVQSVIDGNTIKVQGGNQRISYLEVKDAAQALVCMLKSNSDSWRELYNLGNNESFTLLSLIELIETEAIKNQLKVSVDVADGDDGYNNLIDSRKFYKDFNFNPEVNIQDMVRELFCEKMKGEKE